MGTGALKIYLTVRKESSGKSSSYKNVKLTMPFSYKPSFSGISVALV